MASRRARLPLSVIHALAWLLVGAGSAAAARPLNWSQPLSVSQSPAGGLAAPAATAKAIAGELAQMTGLSPSQVRSADACPAPAPGHVACSAQVIVLRS